MAVPEVWARPERLRRFRVTTGALADGLARRAAALEDTVAEYRAGTETEYEAGCDGAVAAVEVIGVTTRQLGEWVGQVGDAFEDLPGLDGLRFGGLGVLAAALPPALRLDGGPEAGGGGGDERGDRAAPGPGELAGLGLTVASAAAVGASHRDLAAMAAATGRGATAGAGAGAPGSAPPRSSSVARALTVLDLARVGVGSAVHRWSTEPGRDVVDRLGRAALDGALVAGGTYGGGQTGARVGGLACAAGGPVASGACAAAGASLGASVGGRAGEWVGDRLLGDEPQPWERDPDDLAAEIGDVEGEVVAEVGEVLDDVADESGAAADRHAGFVAEHPWLWDDGYRDAPEHAPPPPGPPQPAAGPV